MPLASSPSEQSKQVISTDGHIRMILLRKNISLGLSSKLCTHVLFGRFTAIAGVGVSAILIHEFFLMC